MTIRIMTAVLASFGLLLAATPANAAGRLSCVKTWDEDETLGGRAHATNNCAKKVEVKFVINNDFDSGWHGVEKGRSTSYGYGPFGSHLDRVLIKYNGEEYVNEH
ncbi:hypothetical protein GCM10022247_70790 [Allokutzneria multivorans]|uniref:Uncharacterized protein n=1 Tax=Allokutzneria multivorans TaxID=1142134 RepID=A0ABP7U373_9PSEU